MGAAADRSIFAGYHPLLNYLFFGYVALVPIIFMHPAIFAVSFAAALSWSFYLNGRRAVKFNLGFVLPLMCVAALFNPAFNHRGATILFYMRDNPITLESVVYGVCAAVMIGGVILWFTCYNAVMTSDKFIYLFGRVVPAMSLIVSMALRFIPRYKAQAGRIASARRGIGFDAFSGGFLARVSSGGAILSVMVTWALENAIETSDSMRSRGYGLPGRTAYSIYRFDARDRTLLVALLALMAVVVFALATGAVKVLYFPVYLVRDAWPLAPIAFLCHTAVCFLPLFLDAREDFVWKRSLRNDRNGVA
ncbi:MAG: energy-coupling factor transporter transmembrane protein EcfT [Clostridiales Family XIII bacterium]|jgi:energy-coupling factor transport system permease protein|nr:energy-coupling factor transporter transmembrane protein EcfT [Clostridiales Family XIII bacterium]